MINLVWGIASREKSRAPPTVHSVRLRRSLEIVQDESTYTIGIVKFYELLLCESRFTSTSWVRVMVGDLCKVCQLDQGLRWQVKARDRALGPPVRKRMSIGIENFRYLGETAL